MVFRGLDSLEETIINGVASLLQSQWPDMLQLLDTFIMKTFKSETFWQRLDELYHQLIASSRTVYMERDQWLEENIRTRLFPLMLALLERLEMFKTRDQSLVNSLVTRIESVDIVPHLEQSLFIVYCPHKNYSLTDK